MSQKKNVLILSLILNQCHIYVCLFFILKVIFFCFAFHVFFKYYIHAYIWRILIPFSYIYNIFYIFLFTFCILITKKKNKREDKRMN